MKKVRYKGELPGLLPTLGLEVKPGDIIEVPDDFVNANFEEVPKENAKENTKENAKKG